MMNISKALMSLFLILPLLGTQSGAREAEADPEITENNTDFAFNLYRKLAGSDENLFLSPISVSDVLAMVYAGAKGDTADAFVQALHFAKDHSFHERFSSTLKTFSTLSTFVASNAIWPDLRVKLLSTFTNTLKKYYENECHEVDYSRPETARVQINSWVEKQTQSKIKDLIPRGLLSSSTKIVLTNAVYFKGAWSKIFEERRTQQAPFHGFTENYQAQMMNNEGTFNYWQNESLQLAEFGYQKDQLAMLVLMPQQKTQDAFKKLEADLTAAKWRSWLEKMHPIFLKVHLPRFKLETRYELGPTLVKMGLEKAFSAQADFSGMIANTDGHFSLSEVIHKTFVKVDEKGTEAAAATAAVMRLSSIHGMDAREFKADRPFIFIIYHKPSKTLLFIGKVVNPS